MTTRRCRWFGHRWGAWLFDDFYEVWHRPCLRPGCTLGQMLSGDVRERPRR